MENRGKRQASSIFGGMGFYIALLVCVLAAGVFGYYALLGSTENLQTSGDTQTVSQTDPGTAIDVDASTGTEDVLPVIRQEPVVIHRSESPAPEETAPVSGQESSVVMVDADPPPVSASTAAAAPTPTPASEIVLPLSGETVAAFSVDRLTYDATLGDWRTHDGVDIRTAAGTAVVSCAAGTVLSVSEDSRLGTTVTIDHYNGYVTTYASLQPETTVQTGDTVGAGQMVGRVGNSSLSESALGAHLHFSVSKNGKAVDPETYWNQ